MACCSATRILRITRCASRTENLTRGVRPACMLLSYQKPTAASLNGRAAPRRWPVDKTAAHGGAQQTPRPGQWLSVDWRRSAISTPIQVNFADEALSVDYLRACTAIRVAARGISKRNRKSAAIRWKPARTAPPGSCCMRYPARAAMPISHFRSTSGRAMFAWTGGGTALWADAAHQRPAHFWLRRRCCPGTGTGHRTPHRPHECIGAVAAAF